MIKAVQSNAFEGSVSRAAAIYLTLQWDIVCYSLCENHVGMVISTCQYMVRLNISLSYIIDTWGGMLTFL